MTTKGQRSTHRRKVKRKLPGGRMQVSFEKKRPRKAVCASCGMQLLGVPQEIPSQLKKMPKSQRRPERPYGGVLCFNCLKESMMERARQT